NLVEAAIFGNDPNWGRVVSAAGCVPEALAPFAVEDLSGRVIGDEVCRAGGAHRDRSEVDMTPRELLIEVDLGAGAATGDTWTNYLTHDYGEENSAYSSCPPATPPTPPRTRPTPPRRRWSARTPSASSTPRAPRPERSPRCSSRPCPGCSASAAGS